MTLHKKLIYTRSDGGVSVVIPVEKEKIEQLLGPMTDDEYSAHIYEKSVPADATNVRELEETDIPSSREFRNAWCDVTPESTIDIDCDKAKEVALLKLREVRNAELAKSDGPMLKAMEASDTQTVDTLKAERQALRDATEPLKALDCTGQVNNEELLQQIRELGVLNNAS